MKNTKAALRFLLKVIVVVAFFISVGSFGVMAAPADASITVTDRNNNVYLDNQQTILDSPLDLNVSAKSGVTYYSLKSGYIDVYYNEPTGIPVGSYFRPPYEQGAWVKTVAGNLEAAPKTTLVSTNNWLVRIPLVTPGKTYELRVAAVRNGMETVVFGHRFIGADFIFTSEIVGNTIVSTAYTIGQTKGTFLVAIYKNGVMVSVEMKDFDADSTDTKSFQADLTRYPIGEYVYKMFCWGADYVPLAPAIELK